MHHPDSMPEHTTNPGQRALFLSYAREDSEAARRIAEALRGFGLEVWFDQNELRGGDAWDSKIRTQIRTCALFIPVISATTQARREGYFRREWRFAAERTYDMAAGVPFLLPVVIDDTPESEALVPEEFMRVQWTRLPQGLPTAPFVTQVKRQLEGGVTLPSGPGSQPPARGEAPAAAPAKRMPVLTFGACFAVVVGVGTAFWVATRRPEPPPIPATAPTAGAAPTSPLPAKQTERSTDKSVAVLPFANMSEDKDSGFFADGVHEDVLTNLALIRQLRVVSRTSVTAYRDTAKPMKQIAQELGVTYILEGSVRRAGNKVRVTAQLIHAATDEHVWAQSYDRDLTDVFSIQAELSQQIAAALKTALSPEEKVLIARRPTENPAAYDLFLRARDLANRGGNTQANRSKRIELLEEAVKLDPNFAQAWGELADDCAYWSFSNWEGMDHRLARAKVAIERAVQLAPNDPEVIGSLGTYYYYGYRDYDGAAEQYQRRARQQPNSPTVANSLGLILRRQGKWAESLPHTRRATELDPANVSYQRNLLATLRAGRRWDEAIATQRRIVALTADDPDEILGLAALQFQATGSAQEGDAFVAKLSPEMRDTPRGLSLRMFWAQSKGDYAEVVRLDRRQPYYDEDGQPRWQQAFFAAYGYYLTGDRAGARARLEDWPEQLRAKLKQEPNNAAMWGFLGIMEAILGHKEEALRCADRSVELVPLSRDALDGATVAAFRAIFTYDIVGEKDKAIAEITQLLRVPTTLAMNVHELGTTSVSLAGDPRFEALLRDPKNNAPLF